MYEILFTICLSRGFRALAAFKIEKLELKAESLLTAIGATKRESRGRIMKPIQGAAQTFLVALHRFVMLWRKKDIQLHDLSLLWHLIVVFYGFCIWVLFFHNYVWPFLPNEVYDFVG